MSLPCSNLSERFLLTLACGLRRAAGGRPTRGSRRLEQPPGWPSGGNVWRRFEPSRSPSASQTWITGLASDEWPKIQLFLPMDLLWRTRQAALVALGSGWRMRFSPQPSYHTQEVQSLNFVEAK